MDRTGDIAALILAHAETMAVGSPALRVFYAGVAVKQPTLSKYVWIEYTTNPTEGFGVADTSTLIAQGILLCRLYWPNGVGVVAPLGIAQEIIDHFPRSLVLYDTDLRVEFQAGSTATPIQENAYLYTPTTIPWRAMAS